MSSNSFINRVAGVAIGLGHTLTAPFAKPTHFQRSFRVEKPAMEVFAFWRDFHNFKKVTRSADDIEVRSPRTSRWFVRGPFGLRLMWNAEITAEESEQFVSWKTTSPSDVPHVGRVDFNSVDDGKATEVTITVDYRMPFGFIGDAIAWLTGAGPSVFISEEIARVKLAIEDHRSRAADKAEANHTLDVAVGPPNAPVHASAKKHGRNAHKDVNGRATQNVDLRQRQRTQH